MSIFQTVAKGIAQVSKTGSATGARGYGEPGRLYRGTITDRVRHTYEVQLEDPATLSSGCLDGASVVMGMLGFRTRRLLPVGTRVIVMGGYPSVIIGTIPTGPSPESGVTLRGALEPREPPGEDEQNQTSPPDDVPYDLEEGELDVSNSLGVGLQLMHSFARLQGSALASVETHLLDDMVRVLSRIFRHHSSLGDFEIYHRNRKLFGKITLTSQEHEAWGAVDPENQAEVQDYVVEPGEGGVAMRARLEAYVGHVGDFITLLIRDPNEAAGRLGAPGKPKLRMHVNLDGSFLLQGMGDIVLEHQDGIIAPHDLCETGEEVMEQEPNTSPLRPPAMLEEAVREQDPIALAYGLRVWSRWLSGTHAVQRFLQHPQGWAVPPESPPENPYGSAQDDKTSVQPSQHKRAYATVRLNRDGSVNVFSQGSSLLMAEGNAQLTCPKDLLLEAGGNLTLRAGRNILALARNHIEWVASLGGIVQTCLMGWRVLTERGQIHLRSDRSFDQGDTNEPETNEPTGINNRHPAILLEAQRHGAALMTRSGVQVQITEGDLTISGANDERNIVRILNFKSVNLLATSLTMVLTDVRITCLNLVALVARVLNLNNTIVLEGSSAPEPDGRSRGLVVRGGVFLRDMLRVAGAIFGPKTPPQPIEEGEPMEAKPHLNHVRLNDLEKDQHEPAVGTAAGLDETPAFPRVRSTTRGQYGFQERALRPSQIRWRLTHPQAYSPTDRWQFRSLSQEWLKSISQEESPTLDIEVLTPQSIRLTGGRIPERAPHFPIENVWYGLESQAPPLDKPSDKDPGDVSSDTLTLVPIELRTVRRAQ